MHAVAFLAMVYQRQGKYDKAEELRLRVIQGYEQIHGAQDPKTLEQKTRLADSYLASHQYAKAEDLMERGVQDYTEVYGAQDPKTLKEKVFLADVYFHSSQYAKPEEVMVQAVRDYTEVYGEQDPKTLKEIAFLDKVRRTRQEADSDDAAGRDRSSECGGRDEQSSTDLGSNGQDGGSDEAIHSPRRGYSIHQSYRDRQGSPIVIRSRTRKIRVRFGTKRRAAERP
jgi:tetratricopeptide (TPR) repeat protein